MQQTQVQVNVKDICFEKNLYELKNEDGSYIAQNRIENTFGRIENTANRVIDSIMRKSNDKKCFNCGNILSEEDKSILIIFMRSLLFRDPDTIESGIEFLKQSNDSMDIRKARNFTLLNLLPLGVNSEWDNNTIILTATKNYCGMAFQIGVTSDDLIITSDRPVIEFPPNEDESFNRPKAVVFPLTSKLVLYLFPLEKVHPHLFPQDSFFELDQERIKDVQTYVAASARKWIYSREPLTEGQLDIIRKVRSEMN